MRMNGQQCFWCVQRPHGVVPMGSRAAPCAGGTPRNDGVGAALRLSLITLDRATSSQAGSWKPVCVCAPSQGSEEWLLPQLRAQGHRNTWRATRVPSSDVFPVQAPLTQNQLFSPGSPTKQLNIVTLSLALTCSQASQLQIQ